MDEPACPGCRQLLRRVAELEAKVAELTRLLEEAVRSRKRQAAPFSKGQPKAKPKKNGRKSGSQHGEHHHREPPSGEQIDEVHEVALPEACPACGGPVEEDKVEQQFQTEIPRKPLHRQFNIRIGHCRHCGKRLQGRHPSQTSDALGAAAAQLGPDAQAAVVVLNKEAGLSHGKVARTFHNLFGIRLSRGASAQITLRAAQHLQPTYADIQNAIRQSRRLAIDETGWRIGGQSAWLHAWVAEQATCYAIDPHRSAKVLEEVIGLDWDGVLNHDGFASYDRFREALHQQCLDHLLRRARGLLETARAGAVRFPRQVIGLFTQAIHLRNQYLRGQKKRAELLQAQPRFENRLLRLLLAKRRNPSHARLRDHLVNHLDEWFPFLAHPDIPPTNYQGEQAIRPAVVNRKVWGGNRTAAGAKAQALLTSVLQTCKQQAKSAVQFVSDTLRGLTTNFFTPLPALATR